MLSERPGSQEQSSQSEPFLYISTEIGADAGNGGAPIAWSLHGTAAKRNEQIEKEAFERGIKEGEGRARAAFDKDAKALSSAIATTIEQFKKERAAYFDRIEPEIVQLALAIARKILHREAQMDPLLLAGMVHVALERIEGGTRVRLRANPLDVHSWNEYFSQSNGAAQSPPELIGDETLQRGECTLETELGSTQVSLDIQLKEIEQGFFDLLEHRPR